jgi:2-dehydropantoate 2-reductase
MKKVLWISAGAVGAYFGGRLRQGGGAEVAVTLRSDYEQVRQNGFQISAEKGPFSFQPDGVYRSAGEYPEIPDYIIVSAKVLPWISVPELIRPAVKSRKTVIVLIQNGIGIEEETANAFPENELISTVAYIGATRTGKGTVTQAGAQRLIMGKFGGGDSEAGKILAELFRRGNVEAEYTDDIAKFRWKKLLWNTTFNTVSVLSGGLNTREMCDRGIMETLCRELMEETAAAAKSAGYEFSADDLDANMEYTRNFPPYKTSMLVDYEAGRPLEVDAILGNVCRIAEQNGISVPRLRTCYALLQSCSPKE